MCSHPNHKYAAVFCVCVRHYTHRIGMRRFDNRSTHVQEVPYLGHAAGTPGLLLFE